MNKILIAAIGLSLLSYTLHTKAVYEVNPAEYQDEKQSDVKPEDRKAQENVKKEKDAEAAEARDAHESAYLHAKLIVETPLSGYAVNSTKLTPAMEKLLDEKVKILKERSDMTVTLVGNTCGLGSEEVNERIGFERANHARNYLISKGVDPQKLKINSKGKRAPIAKNSTEAERRQNRRVTFEVN